MKLKRAILGVLVATSVLASSFTVFARESCPGGIHSPKVLYNKVLQYREKTGEHVVKVDGGKEAVCYIYNEYYLLTYYCQSCGAYTYENHTARDVHSLH